VRGRLNKKETPSASLVRHPVLGHRGSPGLGKSFQENSAVACLSTSSAELGSPRIYTTLADVTFGPAAEPPSNYVISHAGLLKETVVSRYDLEMLDRSKCIKIYSPPLPLAALFPTKIGSFDIEAMGFDLADREAGR